MLRTLIILLLVTSTARADDKGAVALLPLDADAKLEVYGQAVASEIAQALIAAKIDVVVVLPKMTVPQHAKLIVAGKISSGKGGAIDISLVVREPKSPTIIQPFQATAPNLGKLDTATSELAQKMAPMLREKLEELGKKPLVITPAEPVKPIVPVNPTAVTRPIIIGVGAGKNPSQREEMFRAALAESVSTWVLAHNRTPTSTDAALLDKKTISKTVAGSNTDTAIGFEVLSYSLTGDTVPLGRARVRVRIADAAGIRFDRIVVTDTIVGEKDMALGDIATRVAREVLAILRPHARKAVPGWP